MVRGVQGRTANIRRYNSLAFLSLQEQPQGQPRWRPISLRRTTPPQPKRTQSYEEREAIIFRARERRASNKPGWGHLAKSAFPEVYRKAQGLLQDLHRLDDNAEERTTTPEKWTVIEGKFRETLPETMTALDALAEHVNTWTECDPATIASLLKGATTEQEHFDVILGTHIQPLLEKAHGKFLAQREAQRLAMSVAEKTLQPPEDPGDDTDRSIIFVLEPVKDEASKGARRRRRNKENRRRRVAADAEALLQSTVEQAADEAALERNEAAEQCTGQDHS